MNDDWKNYLDGDERVLWNQRAGTRIFSFHAHDLFMVPFSLIWLSIVALMLVTFSMHAGSFVFDPILVPFLLVGFYGLFGRFLVDAYARSKTGYALTNKRALILKKGSLRSQPLANSVIEMHLRTGRSGKITFGTKPSVFGLNNLSIWLGNDGSFTFREIADPAAVYKLARSVQNGEYNS